MARRVGLGDGRCLTDQRREASVAVVTPLLYVSRPVGELKVYICRICMAGMLAIESIEQKKIAQEGDSDPWCAVA